MGFIYLKPCPFCGHTTVGVHTSCYWSAMSYVPYAYTVCATCGAQGPIVQRGVLSEDECKVHAMRKWEMRADG